MIDDILDEFDGQLSIDDIYHLTYKELGYLRTARREKRIQRAKNPTVKDMFKG